MLAEGHCKWNWFPMSRQVYITNWYAQQNHLCLDLQGGTDCDCELKRPTTLSVWKLHVKIRGKLPKSSVELKQHGLFSSTTFGAKDSRGGGQSYQHHIPEQQRWGCLAPFNLGKKQWLNGWALLGQKCACLLFNHAEPLRYTGNTCFFDLFCKVWDWSNIGEIWWI